MDRHYNLVAARASLPSSFSVRRLSPFTFSVRCLSLLYRKSDQFEDVGVDLKIFAELEIQKFGMRESYFWTNQNWSSRELRKRSELLINQASEWIYDFSSLAVSLNIAARTSPRLIWRFDLENWFNFFRNSRRLDAIHNGWSIAEPAMIAVQSQPNRFQ